MKKFITSITIVALAIIYLPACKKSSDAQPQQTTLQKIQAKWQLQSLVENDHFSGTDHIITITGNANDYIDFRTDGKVYSSISGNMDVATYSLTGSDTKILIDGTDTFDIKTLTSNSFILYIKQLSGGSDFDETTINMKK